MAEVDIERADFEQWFAYVNRVSCAFEREAEPNSGIYKNPFVQICWEGWKAAVENRVRRSGENYAS